MEHLRTSLSGLCKRWLGICMTLRASASLNYVPWIPHLLHISLVLQHIIIDNLSEHVKSSQSVKYYVAI